MHSPSGHYSDSSAVNTHHKDWKILFSQNCSHLKRHYAECSYTVQNIRKLFDNLCTHWRADHSLNVRDGWLEIQEELSISFIEKNTHYHCVKTPNNLFCYVKTYKKIVFEWQNLLNIQYIQWYCKSFLPSSINLFKIFTFKIHSNRQSQFFHFH